MVDQNKSVYTAEDISVILQRSESYCYKLIKSLNAELRSAGYITVSGRIPRKYFEKRVLGGGDD